MESKDILRVRLSAESVMNIWNEHLNKDATCKLLMKQRFGKTSLILQAEGESIDPTAYQDELLLSVSNNPNIAAALGLPAEYRYTGGRNELVLRLPEKKASPARYVLIALISAIILGIVLRIAIPEIAGIIAENLFTPLAGAITKLLSLIAGPLVFLSIVSGINAIGDFTSFGKIGVELIKNFLVKTFILSVLVCISFSWMYTVTASGSIGNGEGFLRILEMILDIIPSNIVSPLETGNVMQIIFIAVCAGLSSIMISDVTVDTVNIFNQINAIVQCLMTGISKLLPFYIFLSLVNLIITSSVAELSQIYFPLLLVAAYCLLLPLIYGLYTSAKTGIPAKQLFHMQMQTFLIALTTASSAAAFNANVECCEKQFNIDKNLVRFGVPFGQVVFMPGSVMMFEIISLYAAKQNAIPISWTWLITMVIVVTILAAANPPIPGGSLTCVLVLFTQLNIPASYVAVCAAAMVFSDYVETACNITCLQQELLLRARKLNMLNISEKS